jgi:Xaa-Pro aminopeptidase
VPPSTSTVSSVSAGAEAASKREAVLESASRRGYPGVVATEAPTVRWLLCGRGRPVVFGLAAYIVVVGEDETVVLHPDIEASRVDAEERLEELGVRVETFPWFEGPDAVLADLAPGFAAAAELENEVGTLRRELRPEEVDRYRAAARDSAAAMVETLATVTPDTTELEATAELGAACLRRGLSTPVLLAGGEGRQEVHRHPIPTRARLGGHALLAVTAERAGLHVSITRLVSFGDPPAELARRVRLAAEVDAAMLSASRPGTPLDEILRVAADAYEQRGFPEEWRRHHQGGITGYAGREVFATPGEATPLPRVGAVAWNPSVTGGGKSEDTALVTEDGLEILTRTPELPEVELDGLLRPGILIR